MTIGAPDTQGVFRLMTEAQFPHGLRCTRCSRVILPGQPFTDDPTGVHGGVVLVELICVYCDREQCWCQVCDAAGHTNWPPQDDGARTRRNTCPECGKPDCHRAVSHNLGCERV